MQDISGEQIDPLTILQEATVFRRLPSEVLVDMAAMARIERFPDRALIVQRDTHPKHIRYIIEGRVDSTVSTPEGREAWLPAHRRGDWVTWGGCMLDGVIPHDLWAGASSVMLALPIAFVRAAVCASPEALLDIVLLLGESQRALMSWHFAVTLVSDERRLARLLFHMMDRDGAVGSNAATVKITQEEIGNLGLGSRQHIARLLTKLEKKGLIETSYGKIHIRAVAGLRELGFG
jgi:CRP-like cAMP-binding protein